MTRKKEITTNQIPQNVFTRLKSRTNFFQQLTSNVSKNIYKKIYFRTEFFPLRTRIESVGKLHYILPILSSACLRLYSHSFFTLSFVFPLLQGEEDISTHFDENITAPIDVTTARNFLPPSNGETAPESTSAEGVCEKCSSTLSTVEGDTAETFELTTVDISPPTTTTTARGLVVNASDAGRTLTSLQAQEFPWPVKKEAVVEGDIVLGGLMMVHEREDTVTCGPVMPQGGIQALEAMLYTLDKVNESRLLPNITVGAHILDDCDKDTYGLEMAVDFIKGR